MNGSKSTYSLIWKCSVTASTSRKKFSYNSAYLFRGHVTSSSLFDRFLTTSTADDNIIKSEINPESKTTTSVTTNDFRNSTFLVTDDKSGRARGSEGREGSDGKVQMGESNISFASHSREERRCEWSRESGRGDGRGGRGNFIGRDSGRGRGGRGRSGPFKPPPITSLASRIDSKAIPSASTAESYISDTRPHKSHWDKKNNFAKTFLEPASHGQLMKGHDSGIPKLAARKHKSTTLKDAFPQKQDRTEALSFVQSPQQQSLSPIQDLDNITHTSPILDTDDDINMIRDGMDNGITPHVDDIISGRQSLKSVVEQYSKEKLSISKASAKTSTQIARGDERTLVSSTDTTLNIPKKIMSRDDLIALFQAPSEISLNSLRSNEIQPAGSKRSSSFIALQRSITESQLKTGVDAWGDSLTKAQREKLLKSQKPLQQSNPGASFTGGIWPTEHKLYSLDTPHADMRREPIPIAYPTNRISPSIEFVTGVGAGKKKYQSFLSLQRIPQPVFDKVQDSDKSDDKIMRKVLGSFGEPVHRNAVASFVSSVLGVDITQVFPTSMTSAFVGFDSAEQAADVVLAYRSRKGVPLSYDNRHSHYQITNDHSPIQLTMELLEGGKGLGLDSDSKMFVASCSNQSLTVRISNLPAGIKTGTLLSCLHGLEPSILDIESLSKDDIMFSDPMTALLRLPSSCASSVALVIAHLQDKLTPYQYLLFLPAQRSILHSGYTGPARHYEVKRLGPNLIVHGDMPSLEFFRSHAMVLHLANVPNNVTPTDIAQYFQRYCLDERDVLGSAEFVYDLEGHFTGRVYVGFDLQEEGIAAWKDIESTGQRIQLFGLSDTKSVSALNFDMTTSGFGPFVRVRPVKEKNIKRGQKLAARTYRREDELLESLSNWEQYVDVKDLEYLDSMGVSKHVLEEAFVAVRYNNPTFGVEDWARQGEKLRNQKKPGQHFREFVKLYVQTLKEVGTSRENPGMMYEGMFLPGEEMDLSLFDMEEARLTKLQKDYQL